MGLLLDEPIFGVYKTIRIPFESWKYLYEKKSGEVLSERCQKRIKNGYPFSELGYQDVRSVDMGLSLDEMKWMLDEVGLPWEEGPEVECIDV